MSRSSFKSSAFSTITTSERTNEQTVSKMIFLRFYIVHFCLTLQRELFHNIFRQIVTTTSPTKKCYRLKFCGFLEISVLWCFARLVANNAASLNGGVWCGGALPRLMFDENVNDASLETTKGKSWRGEVVFFPGLEGGTGIKSKLGLHRSIPTELSNWTKRLPSTLGCVNSRNKGRSFTWYT